MTREERAKAALIDSVSIKTEWEFPEPNAALSIETAVAFALAFADAEAAAMRERAAEKADIHVATGYMSGRERDYCHQHGDEIAELIRSLPATGEVERG